MLAGSDAALRAISGPLRDALEGSDGRVTRSAFLATLGTPPGASFKDTVMSMAAQEGEASEIFDLVVRNRDDKSINEDGRLGIIKF